MRATGPKTIKKSLFIYGFAALCGAILGFSSAQLIIWSVLFGVGMITPSAHFAQLLQRFGWPVAVLGVAAGIVRGVRIAYRITHGRAHPPPPPNGGSNHVP